MFNPEPVAKRQRYCMTEINSSCPDIGNNNYDNRNNSTNDDDLYFLNQALQITSERLLTEQENTELTHKLKLLLAAGGQANGITLKRTIIYRNPNLLTKIINNKNSRIALKIFEIVCNQEFLDLDVYLGQTFLNDDLVILKGIEVLTRLMDPVDLPYLFLEKFVRKAIQRTMTEVCCNKDSSWAMEDSGHVSNCSDGGGNDSPVNQIQIQNSVYSNYLEGTRKTNNNNNKEMAFDIYQQIENGYSSNEQSMNDINNSDRSGPVANDEMSDKQTKISSNLKRKRKLPLLGSRKTNQKSKNNHEIFKKSTDFREEKVQRNQIRHIAIFIENLIRIRSLTLPESYGIFHFVNNFLEQFHDIQECRNLSMILEGLIIDYNTFLAM